MKARKIILLVLIVVLACVYALQLVNDGKGSVTKVELSGEPDRLILQSATNGTIIMSQIDGEWYVGENAQYKAQDDEVKILVNALREYTILQTVSKGDDADVYGLGEDSAITVSAYEGDTLLCRLDVGKDASTARQSYIRQDGKKEICLISDSFYSVFSVTMDDVRNRSVYNYNYTTIVKAAVATTEEGLVMMQKTDDEGWIGSYEGMSSSKIESWISIISSLNTASWYPDGYEPTGDAIGAISFQLEDGTSVTCSIYSAGEDEDRYIGTSSETPYAFTVSSYTEGRLLQKLEDFME